MCAEKRQCGDEGCYAVTYGLPTAWAATTDNTSVCCYDPADATCTLGAVEGDVRKMLLLPRQLGGVDVEPCGLGYRPRLSDAQCDLDRAQCVQMGYAALCGSLLRRALR